MRFLATVFVLVALLAERAPQHQEYTLQSASDAVRACIRDLGDERCTEDAAAFLAEQYEKGVTSVLPLLVRAGLHSDAALAETLGAFYADLLAANPEPFVRELTKYRHADQESLAELAASADGSGLNEPTYKAARQKVEALKLRSKGDMRRTATLVLKAVVQAHQPPN